MARERLDVRQIRDVLRLHFLGTSRNKIAGSLGIGRNTVSDYLGRIAISGIRNFAEVSGLDDVELERRLGFWRGHTQAEKRDRDKPLPDFLNIHNELRRDGVTLRLLWEEYLAENPKGYKYSQFAERYCKWKRKLSVVMRQTHRGGEKSFVDYSKNAGERWEVSPLNLDRIDVPEAMEFCGWTCTGVGTVPCIPRNAFGFTKEMLEISYLSDPNGQSPYFPPNFILYRR